METQGQSMVVDTLLEDSKWLRRLASHLVADPSRADDLVQETWIAVLRRDPSAGRPSRSWLSAVLRNLVRRGIRSEGRRQDHEALGAEGLPTAEDPASVTARLDGARILAEELQKLPEPYRGTLYLRYFEGLTPQAIAKQLGIPAGTVRWRAAHGRELLKAALVSRDGLGWDQWMAFLLPLATPSASAVSPIVIGAAMTAKWTLVGGLAGALTAGALQVIETPPEASGPKVVWNGDDPGAPLGRGQVPGTAAVGPGGPTGSQISRTLPPVSVDPTFGLVGFGVVQDEAGEPVSDAVLTLTDSDLHSRTVSTGTTGSWSQHGLQSGDLSLTVNAEGFWPQRVDFTVPPGKTFRRDVNLVASHYLPVRFEGPAGEQLALDRLVDSGSFLGVALTTERPGATLPGDHGRRILFSEIGRYSPLETQGTVAKSSALEPGHHGVLECRSEFPAWASATFGHLVLESRRLTGPVSELVFVIDPDDLQQATGGVRLTLVDQVSGAAVAGGLELQYSSGGKSYLPEVDGGQLVFRGVPPSAIDLVLRSEIYEYVEREVAIQPGAELDLGVIRVGAKVPIEVRVVDPKGKPVVTNVHAVRPSLVSGPWDRTTRVRTQSDAKGTTTIWGLAPGLTEVTAGGRDGLARTVKLVDTTDGSPVRIVVSPGTEVVFARGSAAPYTGEARWAVEGEGGRVYAGGRRLADSVWLNPGEYTLRSFDRQGRELTRTRFDVGGDRLVVRVKEGGQ